MTSPALTALKLIKLATHTQATAVTAVALRAVIEELDNRVSFMPDNATAIALINKALVLVEALPGGESVETLADDEV